MDILHILYEKVVKSEEKVELEANLQTFFVAVTAELQRRDAEISLLRKDLDMLRELIYAVMSEEPPSEAPDSESNLSTYPSEV